MGGIIRTEGAALPVGRRAFGLGAAAALLARPARAEDPILIGVPLELSGRFVAFGTAGRRGPADRSAATRCGGRLRRELGGGNTCRLGGRCHADRRGGGRDGGLLLGSRSRGRHRRRRRDGASGPAPTRTDRLTPASLAVDGFGGGLLGHAMCSWVPSSPVPTRHGAGRAVGRPSARGRDGSRRSGRGLARRRHRLLARLDGPGLGSLTWPSGGWHAGRAGLRARWTGGRCVRPVSAVSIAQHPSPGGGDGPGAVASTTVAAAGRTAGTSRLARRRDTPPPRRERDDSASLYVTFVLGPPP